MCDEPDIECFFVDPVAMSFAAADPGASKSTPI
jgi:hypothetical protein